MKYAFYILILANVVFFLWESNITGRGYADGSYRELRLPHTVERIALLSERAAPPEKTSDAALAKASAPEAGPEPNQKTASVSEPVQKTVPPVAKAEAQTGTPPGQARIPETTCFQWGPLIDETRARHVLDLVKARSDQASLIKKPSDLAEGWWVLFPRAHDMEAAKSNRKMLLEKGVTDLWLFDKGPLQGAISLGLFKTRNRAEQAQKRFTERNIITEIVPRLVQNEAYWVRIPWTRPASELEEILKSADPKGTAEQRLPPIPCN
ncbi:hypothetical protein ACWJKU_04620 [Methylocaldum sp. MU1018]